MGMMQGRVGQGMMQMMEGMHQQMMQNPVHRASMMTFMLPVLADTLGLSEQQIEQVNQLKSEAMTQRQEHQEQMTGQREELINLFEGDQHPAPDAVRQRLTAMAEMRAGQQAAMYETAQQMRQVLSDEQLQTLGSLTHQQKMRQMMTQMPMMDMMKMMRTMHGGMMGQGMMQGGVMQNMPMGKDGMMKQGGMQNMPRQQNDQNR